MDGGWGAWRTSGNEGGGIGEERGMWRVRKSTASERELARTDGYIEEEE